MSPDHDRMTARVVKNQGGIVESISMNQYDLATSTLTPDKVPTSHALTLA
jgi:hypothetical protein